MQTETITLNGHPFFVRRWGDPELPPLLMLHGFPEYGGAWADLAPHLSDSFHCIAPDQRGYGRSWAPEGVENYTGAKLASDMAALDKLQHGKRTCPDCFTNECQACAAALIKAGCPVGNMPAWGRDNPDSAGCIRCAMAHNANATKPCGAQYMVEKACGTAGGFPKR